MTHDQDEDDRPAGTGKSTKSRKTPEALRVSEIRYRRLFETARDGILILDAVTCKITDANPFMVELLGYQREELLGRELFEIGLLRDAAASAEAFRELQANGYIRYEDLPLQTKWGKRREVEFVSNVYAENGHQVIQCNIRDITTRKQTERALKEGADRCQFVAESMPQKIFTADAKGEVDYFNRQWLEFAGLSSVQMKGRSWTHFVHPEEKTENLRLWQQALDNGTPFQCEHRFRRADGIYRWHLSHVHAMRDEDGKVLMWIGSNTDIDDQKRAGAELGRLMLLEQEARAAAEAANRLKDAFLATVSHELRTPLTVILGWSSMLRQGGLDEADITRAIDTIDRNARAQAQLIEDLLDVSRIAAGKLRLEAIPVRLATIIGLAIDSARLSADAKGIEVSAYLDPDVGLVTGDPDRLQQVMSNLLSNAIKFTSENGHVDVRLEQVNSQAQITVSDNGQGIPVEFLPRVFDSFRQADNEITRKQNGLGLGLSIVRNIVEMHGGTISAGSRGEGQGAAFTVNIPLLLWHGAEQTVSQNVSDVYASEVEMFCPPELSGLRILIVDDEADARVMITTLLQQCGAEVQASNSAAAGLTIIEQWQPDLLLSDIAMPEKDGCWLIAQIRALEEKQHAKRLPAVALTAYIGVENRTQALRAGFDMFVPKPIVPSELLMVIASLIAPA